jgi:hypothetical protein
MNLSFAVEAESARPFDGFDKLTASRLRAPSEVEGLALAATRSGSLNCGIQDQMADAICQEPAGL